MIVRISGDGQYRFGDGETDRLNELDNAVVSAVEGGDEAAFRSAFDALLAAVRDGGERLADDELEGSDLIVPPSDISFEEAAADFSGEGLIPG